MFPIRHLFFFKVTFWLKGKMQEKIVFALIANREQKKPGSSKTTPPKKKYRVKKEKLIWKEGGKGVGRIINFVHVQNVKEQQ